MLCFSNNHLLDPDIYSGTSQNLLFPFETSDTDCIYSDSMVSGDFVAEIIKYKDNYEINGYDINLSYYFWLGRFFEKP